MNFIKSLTSNKESKDVQNDHIEIYLKPNFKSIFKVKPKFGMTVEQLIQTIIDELKISQNVQYQILLVSHRAKDPEGNIILRRKLYRFDQPFRILQSHKHSSLQQSLLLDYIRVMNPRNQTYFDEGIVSIAEKYDLEVNAVRVHPNELKQHCTILKFNSIGVLICEQGKMLHYFPYSTFTIEFQQDLVIVIKMEEHIQILRVNTKSDYLALCKFIKQQVNKVSILQPFIESELKLNQMYSAQFTEYESMVQVALLDYQSISGLNNFQYILKLVEQQYTVPKDNIDKLRDTNQQDNQQLYDNHKDSFILALSQLYCEQYRDKMIRFNNQFKLIASFKIDEDGDVPHLHQIESVRVSQEDFEKYRNLLA